MDKSHKFALRAFEIGLFCFGFILIVPPVTSIEGQVSRLTPILLIGGGAFGASLMLGFFRGAENRVTVILKFIFYLALAWLIHKEYSDSHEASATNLLFTQTIIAFCAAFRMFCPV